MIEDEVRCIAKKTQKMREDLLTLILKGSIKQIYEEGASLKDSHMKASGWVQAPRSVGLFRWIRKSLVNCVPKGTEWVWAGS